MKFRRRFSASPELKLLSNRNSAQMPWQRPNHNQLFFVIMEEINPQQIFGIISHPKVGIEGAFNSFSRGIAEILDLILRRCVLNRRLANGGHSKRTAVFFRASAAHLLAADPMIPLLPVVGGQKIQRVADQAHIHSASLSILQTFDGPCMEKKPTGKVE